MFQKANRQTIVNPQGSLHLCNNKKTLAENFAANKQEPSTLHQFQAIVDVKSLISPVSVALSVHADNIAILTPSQCFQMDTNSKTYNNTLKIKATAIAYISTVTDQKQRLILATKQNSLQIVCQGVTEFECQRTDIGNVVRDIRLNYLRDCIACVSNHSIELYEFISGRLRRFKCFFEKGSVFIDACFSSDGKYLYALLKTGVLLKYTVSHHQSLRQQTQLIYNFGVPISMGSQLITLLASKRLAVVLMNKGFYVSPNNQSVIPKNEQKSAAVEDWIFYKFPAKKSAFLCDDKILTLNLGCVFCVDFSSETVLAQKLFQIPDTKPLLEFDCLYKSSKKECVFAGVAQKTIYYAAYIKIKSKPLLHDSSQCIILDILKGKDALQILKPQRKPRQQYHKLSFQSSSKHQLKKQLQEFFGKSQNKQDLPQLLRSYFRIYGFLPDRENTHSLLLGIPFDVPTFQGILTQCPAINFTQIDALGIQDKKLKFQLQNVLSVLISIDQNLANNDAGIRELIKILYPLISLYKTDIKTVETFLRIYDVWGKGLFGTDDHEEELKLALQRSLQEICPELTRKFLKSFRINLSDFLLPSLRVLLVDILPQEDWLRFMDNLVLSINTPEFFLLFVISYLKALTPQLLMCKTIQNAHQVLLEEKDIDIEQIFAEARQRQQKACPQCLKKYYQREGIDSRRDDFPNTTSKSIRNMVGTNSNYYSFRLPERLEPLLPSNSNEIMRLMEEVSHLEQKQIQKKQDQIHLYEQSVKHQQEKSLEIIRREIQEKSKQRRRRLETLQLIQDKWKQLNKKKQEVERVYQEVRSEEEEKNNMMAALKREDRLKDEKFYAQETQRKIQIMARIKDETEKQIKNESDKPPKQKTSNAKFQKQKERTGAAFTQKGATDSNYAFENQKEKRRKQNWELVRMEAKNKQLQHKQSKLQKSVENMLHYQNQTETNQRREQLSSIHQVPSQNQYGTSDRNRHIVYSENQKTINQSGRTKGVVNLKQHRFSQKELGGEQYSQENSSSDWNESSYSR